jgi:hypothetical protein
LDKIEGGFIKINDQNQAIKVQKNNQGKNNNVMN